jgi:protein-S-isoprenylcysteine O-methyltransferase Ste14
MCREGVMRPMSIKEICWNVILTVLCIACFPANPFVLTGLIEPGFYLPLFVIGWVVWAGGMALVMAPILMFPRRGGVAKGKSFVHTTRLVDTGIYGVVRHPQYLGGILALFLTTFLLFPHWLFVALGIPGIAVLYFSTIMEEKRLVKQFGDDYLVYMKKVPRINIIQGIYRQFRQQPG